MTGELARPRPRVQSGSRVPWRPRLDARPLVIGSAVVVIGYLVIVPLGYLIWQTFRQEDGFGLEGFRRAYETTGLGVLTFNSMAFAPTTWSVSTAMVRKRSVGESPRSKRAISRT